MKKLCALICIVILFTAIPAYGYDPFQDGVLRGDYANANGYKYENVIIECDYGSYNGGRVVILDIKGEENKNDNYELYIGELCFRFSSKEYADRFLYYRWGVYDRYFLTVKEAYEKGYLSGADVYDIALLHGVETYSPEELTVEEKDCKWSFDPASGKLTVEGDIPDYEIKNGKSTSPSSKWRYDIKEVEMKNCLSVGDYAFYNCERLEKVTLYKNLRSIGKGAFEDCIAICDFSFPEGIREVSEDAFKGCGNLNEMTFYGKAPKLYEGMLKGKIYYPENSEFWSEDVRRGYSESAEWIGFDAPDIENVNNYFDDLAPRGWYLSGIQYCYNLGFMSGMGNCRFAPNEVLTREQVAMVMYQYLEADETYTKYSFKDVVPGAWYADAVEWMYQKGYTKGISCCEYGVGRPVTRQDLMTLIFRDYKDEYWLGQYHIKGGINSFGDVGEIADYAYDAMRFAVEVCDSSMCRGTGEITPVLYGDEGMLRPRDTCTRAEAAAIFQRSVWADYFSPVSTKLPPSS